MKIVLLNFLLSGIFAAEAWAAVPAQATIDEIMRRGVRPFPPGEP
jgi:hypothetical protein